MPRRGGNACAAMVSELRLTAAWRAESVRLSEPTACVHTGLLAARGSPLR